jgi:hypothetical protein
MLRRVNPKSGLVGGRFVLERRVGAGGMGEVYRARDEHTGAPVALKLMRNAGVELEVARFEREAKVLEGLSHPHVVGFVAHGEDPTHGVFLAMEWLEGEDLDARLSRQPLTAFESVELARGVALALAAAHERGVVHRDVKPSNLLLERGEPSRVRLVDFGIARADRAGTLTGSGIVLGTVGYMAPEQAGGARSLDARADLFSLGCVLYECLTGERAFPGEHAVAVLVKLLHSSPAPLSVLRPELPSALSELVMRLLEKDPAKRPASAATVARELLAIGAIEGASPSAPVVRAPAPEPSRATGERRVVELLLVDPGAHALETVSAPLADLDATLAAEDLERSALDVAQVARRLSADATVLRNGFVLVSPPSRSGSATPRDRAEALALVALEVRERLPLARAVLASGRGEGESHAGVGPAADRAATLLAHVGRGEVVLDDTSARLLDERFELERSGERSVLVRERTGALGDRLLLGRPTPCVGRAKELALVSATLAECLDEPCAKSVVVLATAGIGKTRLVQEIMRLAAKTAPELRVLSARGDPIEVGSSFAMLRTIVRRAAELSPDADGPACDEGLRRVLGGAADAERAIELLRELLGRPVEAPKTPELRAARNDASELRAWVERSFVALLLALTRDAPLFLVLDDLHWGDDATVSFVGSALRACVERPLFVLGAGRPEASQLFAAPWPSSQTLTLAPLSKRAALDLARSVLTADAEVLAAIVERAQGNAFALEELVRAVAAGRSELPETVQAMVEARLLAEPPEARRVLRAASVFGERSTAQGLAAVTELSAYELEAHTRELVRAELFDDGRGERGELVFRHAIVRDVAYGMLPEPDRRELHRRAAAWLRARPDVSPGVLAEHYERAGDPAAAAHHRVLEVEHVYASGQLARALERADAALASGALSLEQRGVVQVLRAGVFHNTGVGEEGLSASEDALASLPEGSLYKYRARVSCALSSVITGRFDAARAMFDTITRMDVVPCGAFGFPVWNLMHALVALGDRERSAMLAAQLERAIATPDADPSFVVYAAGAIAYAAVSNDAGLAGGVKRALELVRVAEERLPHVGSPLAHGYSKWWRGMVLANAGQVARGKALLEEGLADGERQGVLALRVLAGAFLAYAAPLTAPPLVDSPLTAYRLLALGVEAARAFELAKRRREPPYPPGHFDEAKERASMLLSMATIVPWFFAHAASILGRIALFEGEPARAVELGEQALDVVRTRCTHLRHTALAWSMLVDAYHAAGRDADARALRAEARQKLGALADALPPSEREALRSAEAYAWVFA